MLKYSVKINSDDIEKKELVWGEKYLSPSLSFVSGVCDTSYHLEKYEQLPVSNSINNSTATVKVQSSNFKRYGYVVFNDFYLDINESSTFIIENNEPREIDYKYTVINDKYFYYNDEIKGFKIDNIYHMNDDNEITSEPLIVSSTTNDFKIEKYISFIDDNIVSINGYSFDYDVATSLLLWNGNEFDTSDINCKSYRCVLYDIKDINEYTRFRLDKNSEYDIFESDSIGYCKPYYYIDFKETTCYVDCESEGDETKFYCYIPSGLLTSSITVDKESYSSETEYAEAQKLEKKSLYFATGTTAYDINAYADRFEELGIKLFELTISNLHANGIYNVTDLYSLKNINSFVKIGEHYYSVQSDVTSSNDGNNLLIVLSDENNGINSGDLMIASIGNDSEEIMMPIYSADTEFVIFNGDKYDIEKNICDKLVMLETEYEIEYINGKKENEICIVKIDDDEVPLLIKSIDGGDYSGGTLTRLGYVITDSGSTEQVYSIKPNDGVSIDGNIYQRLDDNICFTDGVKVELVVEKAQGSSTFVCSPIIDEKLLKKDSIDLIVSDLCSFIVDNSNLCSINVKNKIFGNSPITPSLPFSKESFPYSSDDYYNLFDELKVYVNTNYLLIPLGFSFNSGGNALQDDVVENDFFEAEKENAINPIVDMEKDVYSPKFIENDGEYKGCETSFKQIKEIDVNLHFRTRNLDSWKINEGSNRIDTSGVTDNWFVTDVHPYKEMLKYSSSSNKYASTLMKNSDLLGLLYFTNDDVFYQRKKLSKSFLRFSFYDSTDSQSQNLLATSTVFVDEHGLYKRFIDNSRKNVYEYGYVKMPECNTNSSGYSIVGTDVSEASIANKINVSTEFLSKKNDKNTKYTGSTWSETVIKSVNITEDRRLGSRFVIKNKYETDSSSEGFYIYMFKDYSTKLHPRQIYMKIEFNHAGIGKTLDFNIPMEWKRKSSKSLELYPTRKYTLESSDLSKLKSGITLEMKESQSYIPLYAVYDFENKEYSYVFDNRYVDIEDGVAHLNIFEPKYRDESSDDVTSEERRKIISGETDRYVINVNTSQFNEKYF